MFQKALFNAVGQIHQHTHNEQKSFHLTGEGTLLSDKMYSSWCALGLSMKWIYPLTAWFIHDWSSLHLRQKETQTSFCRSNFNPPCDHLTMLKKNTEQLICTLRSKKQKKTKKASLVGFVCCSTSLMESNLQH